MKRDNLTLLKPQPLTPLRASLQSFMLDREAMRCTPKTMEHYTYTCGQFCTFLEGQGVDRVGAIQPAHIRAYLVGLQRRGLRDTTQHAHARGVKAWLNWLVAEGELERSPMGRVSMPRLEKRVPPPFEQEEVGRLLGACDRSTPNGVRDYAIIVALLDTGLRAAEFVSLRVGDVNLRSGLITVVGKGGKQRVVRMGARSRSALLRYLAQRGEIRADDALWLREGGGALNKVGLYQALRRLGQRAEVTPCSPHRFRRTFAIWCLRSGMDLASLRLLMGHSDLTVLLRYLALAREDAERAHRDHSPVDRLLGR